MLRICSRAIRLPRFWVQRKRHRSIQSRNGNMTHSTLLFCRWFASTFLLESAMKRGACVSWLQKIAISINISFHRKGYRIDGKGAFWLLKWAAYFGIHGVALLCRPKVCPKVVLERSWWLYVCQIWFCKEVMDRSCRWSKETLRWERRLQMPSSKKDPTRIQQGAHQLQLRVEKWDATTFSWDKLFQAMLWQASIWICIVGWRWLRQWQGRTRTHMYIPRKVGETQNRMQKVRQGASETTKLCLLTSSWKLQIFATMLLGWESKLDALASSLRTPVLLAHLMLQILAFRKANVKLGNTRQ